MPLWAHHWGGWAGEPWRSDSRRFCSIRSFKCHGVTNYAKPRCDGMKDYLRERTIYATTDHVTPKSISSVGFARRTRFGS
jgi:hypothetical protein